MSADDRIRPYLCTALEHAQAGRCCRIFHGRGKLFGPRYQGITIDWYRGVVFIFSYDTGNRDVITHLSLWFASCAEVWGILAVVVQHRDKEGTPLEILWGTLPSTLYAVEHDLLYHLDVGSHQNIGFFPDMVAMRAWFLANSTEKNVLNLFSYTCSISVAAVHGGARKVVNVDMSSAALSVGRENHRLNNLDTKKVAFQRLNILKSWGRIARQGPYDIVFVDPPTAQGKSFNVTRDYHKVIRRTAEMLVPGGDIFICSNSPSHSVGFLQEQVESAAPQMRFIERIDCGERFKDSDPDAGLKVLRYQAVRP